jgi:hypothetical protein
MFEALFVGARGGGMTSNAMAQRPLADTPTAENIRQTAEMMRRAQQIQEYARARLRQNFGGQGHGMAGPADALPCDCKNCRAAGEAESRSVALLKEWLSPDQLDQYEREKCFNVTGSTGTRYRIYSGLSQNVSEIDDAGRMVRSWCFGPDGDACRYTGDVMLAQKLALETDEMEVRRVANLMNGTPPAWYIAEIARRNMAAARTLF